MMRTHHAVWLRMTKVSLAMMFVSLTLVATPAVAWADHGFPYQPRPNDNDPGPICGVYEFTKGPIGDGYIYTVWFKNESGNEWYNETHSGAYPPVGSAIAVYINGSLYASGTGTPGQDNPYSHNSNTLPRDSLFYTFPVFPGPGAYEIHAIGWTRDAYELLVDHDPIAGKDTLAGVTFLNEGWCETEKISFTYTVPDSPIVTVPQLGPPPTAPLTIEAADAPAFFTTTTLTFSLGQLPDGIVLTSADVEPAPIDGPKEIDPSSVTSTTTASAGGSSGASGSESTAAGSSGDGSGDASTDSTVGGDTGSTATPDDDSPAVAAPVGAASSGVSGSGFVILSLLTGLGSVLLGLGGAWLLGRRRS